MMTQLDEAYKMAQEHVYELEYALAEAKAILEKLSLIRHSTNMSIDLNSGCLVITTTCLKTDDWTFVPHISYYQVKHESRPFGPVVAPTHKGMGAQEWQERIIIGELDTSDGCQNPFNILMKDLKYEYPLNYIIGCNRRFDCLCPYCAKRWRNRNFHKLKDAILGMKHPRFMTLPIKYDKTKGRTDRIYELWELRKYLFKVIKRAGFKINSWIAIIELPNHIHLVYDGSFIPQRKLSQMWHQVTGDSRITDIRDVRAPAKMAHYLSKYMSKMSLVPSKEIEEMKGFHLINSWGIKTEKKVLILSEDGITDIGIEGWKRIEVFLFDMLENRWEKEHHYIVENR